MIGALVLVHFPQSHPFVSQTGPSYELALVYLVLAIMLTFLGPGKWSLDALLFGSQDLRLKAVGKEE
jgi:putative oxidoreductase